MLAEITFSQVWNNPSVRRFFFRDQSEETLQELADRAVDWEAALDKIDNHSDYLDEVEDMFYEDSVEELAEEFGIELYEDEEEDEICR